MFNKKQCKRCGEKANNKYDFCPNCGTPFGKKSKDEDWGMLGKNDFSEIENPFESMMGGLTGKMMNKMLGQAMKMLEAEMAKGMQNTSPQPGQNFPQTRTNVKLMINGKEIKLENINNKKPVEKNKKIGIKTKEFSEENLKKFSKLPKKEPLTKVRRLADKIIYDITMPGVELIDDISLTKLEKSIEIKAIGKKQAYKKIIDINLPITDYYLEKGNLILELAFKD